MNRLFWLIPLLPTLACANPPGFDCSRTGLSSIETLVCNDPELATLDTQLQQVFRAAAARTDASGLKRLKAEQRGWIKGRNDCWKADNHAECTRQAYVEQIAELQARYRLVPFSGPHRFVCGNSPADEIQVSYFDTRPRTLIAERGDRVSLMQQQADTTHYLGRNESLSETRQGVDLIWGYQAPILHCKVQP